MKLDGSRAGDLDGVWTSQRGRLNLNLPTTVSSRGADRGLAGDAHADFLAWSGPAPDGVRLAALENHVIAEHRAHERQRCFGRRGEAAGDCREKNAAGKNRKPRVFRLHSPTDEFSRPKLEAIEAGGVAEVCVRQAQRHCRWIGGEEGLPV